MCPVLGSIKKSPCPVPQNTGPVLPINNPLTLFRNTDTELDIWHTYWSSKSPKSLPKKLSETLEVIYPMQTTFPTIYVLLQILATIPITTCTCERCISRLRFLKTYLRSTMTQERLNGLALLSIHHDRYIDLDDIVNRFARNNGRKMTLLNILDTDDVTEQNKHLIVTIHLTYNTEYFSCNISWEQLY